MSASDLPGPVRRELYRAVFLFSPDDAPLPSSQRASHAHLGICPGPLGGALRARQIHDLWFGADGRWRSRPGGNHHLTESRPSHGAKSGAAALAGDCAGGSAAAGQRLLGGIGRPGTGGGGVFRRPARRMAPLGKTRGDVSPRTLNACRRPSPDSPLPGHFAPAAAGAGRTGGGLPAYAGVFGLFSGGLRSARRPAGFLDGAQTDWALPSVGHCGVRPGATAHSADHERGVPKQAHHLQMTMRNTLNGGSRSHR